MNYIEARKMFCLMPDDEIRKVIRVGMQVLQDRRRLENESAILALHIGDPVEFVDSKGWVWRGTIKKVNRKTVDVNIKETQPGNFKVIRVRPGVVKTITVKEATP